MEALLNWINASLSLIKKCFLADAMWISTSELTIIKLAKLKPVLPTLFISKASNYKTKPV